MPEQCPHSVSDQDQIPTLTDQQWTEFVSDAHAMRQAETTLEAVSYTHLTLPTILLV